MTISPRMYQLIRKIHLYASLTTLVFFAMYLISSYLMMHHDTFLSGESAVQTQTISVEPGTLGNESWLPALKAYGVKGRLENEFTNDEGYLVREYETVSAYFKLSLHPDQQQLTIEAHRADLAHTLEGFHRLRGYKGPLAYQVYAFMVDIMGISLIIFALTGIILWLKVLKNSRLAWGILIGGVVYVAVVMGQLM